MKRIARVTVVALVAALAAGMLPAAEAEAAKPGILQKLLDRDEISWASLRNLTSAQFHTEWTKMKNTGYMPVDIEVDEINGSERVAGVWQKNPDGRGWASLRNLTSDGFHAKWTFYKDKGFVLIDQDAYTLGGKQYYSGIWARNVEGLKWASYRNLTSAEFSAKFDQLKSKYLPLDVEAYALGGQMRYSIIWVENADALSFKLWRDLSEADYEAKFAQYKSAYRVMDLESYTVGAKKKFAAIWVLNKNGRGWKARRDMSAQWFGNWWDTYADAGYRLIDFEAYPTPQGWRYAGVWRQNNDRPNWKHRNAVDDLIEAHAAQFQVPGVSVAIAANGKFTYLRGAGFADVGAAKVASSRTEYRLASVSKAFAGYLSLRLQEKGKLNLNDDTDDYIDDLPAHHTHTLEQLVSNRSCVRHYSDGPDHDELGDQEFATALAASEVFWDDPLACQPPAYKYSTFGYSILGAAMESATGDTVRELVTKEIATRLGIPSIKTEDLDVSNPRRAAIYEWKNNKNQTVSRDDITWKVLGGGLEGSAHDVAEFGMRLLDGTALTSASLTTLWTPPDGLDDYALGWNTGTHLGRRVVGKDGNQTGARSYIRVYPDDGIVVAVLTNREDGGHSAVTLSKDIGAVLLNG